MKASSETGEALVAQIVALEWEQFDQVQNIGGRADCQDDRWTFEAMRRSAFCVWGDAALLSYRADLQRAAAAGRNLLTEKYAYMMEDTDPEYYHACLEPALPALSAEKQAQVRRLTDLLVRDEQAFRRACPQMGARGRALEGPTDWASFATYLAGELKTYSEETLTLYEADVRALLAAGQSPSRRVHDQLARFYDYTDAADADHGTSGL